MSNNSRLTKNLTIIAILSTSLCSGFDIPIQKNEDSPTPQAVKNRSAHSAKKYFLIKTVQGEDLSKRLAQSVETISHPFCHLVASSSVLVDASTHQQARSFSLGKLYGFDGESLGEPEELGRVSLLFGQSPISFETDQCRWMAQSIRCEFRSPKSDLTGGLELTRQIYIDRQGIVYISFRASGSTKNARELLKSGKLYFRIDPQQSKRSQWRVWYRSPDGSLRRPGQTTGTFDYELTGTQKNVSQELLIVAVPMRKGEMLDSVSSDEVEFESKISRSRPIGSMQSAMRRWIVAQFPAWDCPEPWLNKLWAGQVVSICQEIAVDSESDELLIPINSPEDWRLIYDARWLKDPKIARRSLQAQLDDINKKSLLMGGQIAPAAIACLECEPDVQFRKSIVEKISPMLVKWSKEVVATQTVPQTLRRENDTKLLLANNCLLAAWSADRNNLFLQRAKRLSASLNTTCPTRTTSGEFSALLEPEYFPSDYPAFVQWCRSFFPGGDFSWLIDLRIDSAHRHVEKKIPRGVMDMIIARVVGLKTNSTNRLTISPAQWIRHWPYFAIDNLPYRGHNLTVVWQSPDHVQRYMDVPMGLNVFVDGQRVKQMPKLETVEIELR